MKKVTNKQTKLNLEKNPGKAGIYYQHKTLFLLEFNISRQCVSAANNIIQRWICARLDIR